jgi:hypothetical protein
VRAEKNLHPVELPFMADLTELPNPGINRTISFVDVGVVVGVAGGFRLLGRLAAGLVGAADDALNWGAKEMAKFVQRGVK